MGAKQQRDLNSLLRSGDGIVQTHEMPFSDRKGTVRTVMNHGIGLIDGVTIAEHPVPSWKHYNEQAFVEMNFMLEGSMLHTQGDLFKKHRFAPGYHNLLFNPSAWEESELIGPGRFRHVGIHIETGRALSFFTDYIPQLNHLAEKIQKGEPFVMHAPSGRLSSKMNYLFDTVWSHSQAPGLTRLHFEAFNLELLALTCENMLVPGQYPKASALSKTDTEKLHYARELLLSRLCDPPLLRELSVLCGINEFKLKKGFKQLFGRSVLAFVNEMRLEAALVAIHTGDKTISEIAYELGYSHTQHFHRAFKQRYGKTPKSISK